MTGSSRIKGLTAIVFLVWTGAVFSAPFVSAEPIEARHYLGDMAELKGWSGLEKAPGAGRESEDAARLKIPGEAEFRYPEEEGWIEGKGQRPWLNPAGGWQDWPILAVDMKLPEDTESAKVSFSILGPGDDYRREVTLQVAGDGWQTLYVPLDDFRLNDAVAPTYLHDAKGVRIRANGGDGELLLSDVRLQRGRVVGLTAPVQSKPGDPGETIEYDVSLLNCTQKPQPVAMRLEREGGEVMVTTVEPKQTYLSPGEVREVKVEAEIPTADTPGVSGALPEGAREQWTLTAIPNGRLELAESLDFTHIVRMTSPCISDKELSQEEIERRADRLRAFADPESGYPSHLDISGQAMVQEGHRFQILARKYDTVRDAGVLNSEEKEQIEAAFRLYFDIALSTKADHVGNQPLSVVTGALYSALAIQDWHWVERFLKGPCGIEWQIRRGFMDDGWNWEMSTGYSMWSAGMVTRAGKALRPWGVEILKDKFPAVYHESTKTSSRPGEAAGPTGGTQRKAGMFASVWGPSFRNYREIRDTYEAIAPLVNEDGRLPGINDSTPETTGADDFKLAASVYDNPVFARIAEGTYPAEGKLLPSSRADNAGVAMLRSQGVDAPAEQYQALLSYGSHGGHHGHWDRLNMVYLRRFGKLLTHTPSCWYGYGSHMYQMGYYQCSLAHNMIIVDGKNQYPAPSDRLLYHAGDLFQAAAVENETRWSNPRFGGHLGYTEEEKEKGFFETDAGRVKIPEDPPDSEHMTSFTEPIRSRRLMAVTDEYVLLIDNVNAEKTHTYDVIYQFPNFKEFDRGSIELKETREKFDDSPLRTGQFATNARFFEADGPVRANFVPGYNPEKDGWQESQPHAVVKEGMETLSLDVHTAWPPQRKQIVAKNPHNRQGVGWNTYSAARVTGPEASFVTLVEVQKKKTERQIQEVEADGPDQVRVELTDGRVHRWQVNGLDADSSRPEVDMSLLEETADGEVREEQTER